ncbi:MAG: leucine--tRNA ligase [Patescibacteria group bacterium]|nr:leucine--tRNA ligase [Patescibacteria group bacterium]
MNLNFPKIEKKWRTVWEKEGIYKTKDKVKGKKNFYHLVMFPYPSGDLHIGHWYNFAPADIFARFKRMNGFNVMSPMGFDAFGLPAENAAIKKGTHPRIWTFRNIKTMTKQLKNMGAVYDWSREVITAEPSYYKWTQWIFMKLFNAGLAYRKKASANWCPKCHTVLANEQVVDGRCERCETEVIQREIEQWLFKITDYAERLLKDLENLDWPEKTKIMQKNWIGKSEGSIIKFKVKSLKLKVDEIEVFTTRLDTIYGCAYVVVAPEHQIISNLKSKILNLKEVEKYIKKTKGKLERDRLMEDKQKTGVELKGIKAINPFNKTEIPVFVADYVLGGYGTGAVMAVPAHDERDFEFAKKYKLPIKQSIESKLPITNYQLPIIEDGILIDSAKYTGMKSDDARKAMAEWLEQNKLGHRQTNYKLRDWLISRQRYWGSPIPLVFCEHCAKKIKNLKTSEFKNFTKGELLNPGWFAVSEKDLPVKLPDVKKYLPTEEGKSPLAHSEKFIKTKCPKCGGFARRETDTMDTFVCSSWYYLRYADPKNSKHFADSEKLKKWLPVDMYIGGAEHTVLHLLYSRFFTKALFDMKLLNFSEPFSILRHQGMILGPDGQKMSKSKGNVIDPDDLVKKFGVDSVRIYLAFMGPYDQGGLWQLNGIVGVRRFLQKIWTIKFKLRTENKELAILLNKTIKKVGEDIKEFKFNTAVSSLMILLGETEKSKEISKNNFETLLKLLAPFAPYLSEEVWRNVLKNKKSIHLERWPKYNPKTIIAEKFDLIIQVNGKFRDKISVSMGIEKDTAQKLALKSEKIKNFINNQSIKKTIFVPGKLINIVI